MIARPGICVAVALGAVLTACGGGDHFAAPEPDADPAGARAPCDGARAVFMGDSITGGLNEAPDAAGFLRNTMARDRLGTPRLVGA